METETYKCISTRYNDRMGANMCYAEGNLIFFFDYFNMVQVGDTVSIEKDEKNNTVNLWVNNILQDLKKATKECTFRSSKNSYLGI